MTAALRLEAPAKLNLGLRVVGRRSDGLHLLESRLVLLDLADRLTLSAGVQGLSVDGGNAPAGEENLAWRGLVAGLATTPAGLHLALEKRIPVAAGLGGGSSDAAAGWRLGRAWRDAADPSPDDVAALAGIGADVPFFGAARPAADVVGVGERVTPVAPAGLEVLLLHPAFSLPTAAVFAALRDEDWGRHDNDLLPAAIRLRPELRDVIRTVERTGTTPRLSGSGPTLYVASADAERLDAVAARLVGTNLRVTRTRTRREAASIERIRQEDAWPSAT